MKLETNRLHIIPCTEETVQVALNQSYNSGLHISKYLTDLAKDPSLLYWGCWMVVRKADGRFIGDIGFKGKPNENQTVEVGYGFIEDSWHRGYATEAVGALINWAFNTSQVERIIAETLIDNIGSIRVLEKLGMKKTGQTETMINWELKKSGELLSNLN